MINSGVDQEADNEYYEISGVMGVCECGKWRRTGKIVFEINSGAVTEEGLIRRAVSHHALGVRNGVIGQCNKLTIYKNDKEIGYAMLSSSGANGMIDMWVQRDLNPRPIA